MLEAQRSTLTKQQETAQDDCFNAFQSMFDFSPEDLRIKQYPTISPDRWIPHSIKLAELVKHLGAFSLATTEAAEE
jgi:hypothetical protein